MVNRVDKGRRIVNKLKKFLNKAGLEVAKVEYRNKYNKVDLFSLFDLVVIKKKYVAFIQVTTNAPHKHDKFIEFYKKYELNIFQFVWYDRKGWVIYMYDEEGYKKIDLRKGNIKIRIPYSLYVELCMDENFNNLYKGKIIQTSSIEFLDGKIEVVLEASERLFAFIIDIPEKYRKELLKCIDEENLNKK